MSIENVIPWLVTITLFLLLQTGTLLVWIGKTMMWMKFTSEQLQDARKEAHERATQAIGVAKDLHIETLRTADELRNRTDESSQCLNLKFDAIDKRMRNQETAMATMAGRIEINWPKDEGSKT